MSAIFNSRLVRYVMVGGIGYFVNLATFWIAIELLSINPYVALIGAFVTNTANNFLLNRWWTFDGGTEGAALGDFWRFMVVAFACLGWNYFTFFMLYSVAGIPEIPAQAIAVILGIPVGYIGSRSFAFAARDT